MAARAARKPCAGRQRLESCAMSATILDELSWRELIAQSTDLDALAAEAERGPMTVYAGFDPTSAGLHAAQLARRERCSLRIGGADGWGNITAGGRLVRKRRGAEGLALTVPLGPAADGTKFGKSTGGGSLWRAPQMTSPSAWYQYFINTAD